MISRELDTCLMIGRFNVFHLGHQALANLGLMRCNRLLILVGSAQESGTPRNPFSVETRIKVIRSIFPCEAVIVRGLPDLTNENDITPAWGDYLLENVISILGKEPDAMVYGNDESREGWFNPERITNIKHIKVPRLINPITATYLRQLMVENNKEEWCKHHSFKIHDYFDSLREELMACPAYQ